MTGPHGKFTDEQIACFEKALDDYARNDKLYCSDSYRNALIHNEAVDTFLSLGLPYKIILQNCFLFPLDGKQFYYYANSNKWRAKVKKKNT